MGKKQVTHSLANNEPDYQDGNGRNMDKGASRDMISVFLMSCR